MYSISSENVLVLLQCIHFNSQQNNNEVYIFLGITGTIVFCTVGWAQHAIEERVIVGMAL